MTNRGVVRALEIAMFAVVLAAGTTLSWLALAGDDEGIAAIVPNPVPFPGPGSPPPLPPPVGGVPPETASPGTFPEVNFIRADSEIVPPPSGCSVTIIYTWEVDPTTTPPARQAVIRFDGPAKSGEYRRRVQRGQIRFAIDVPGDGMYTADVVSVDERPTFPTPLPVTLSFPGCGSA